MRRVWFVPLVALGLAGCVGTTAPTFGGSSGPATGAPTDFNAQAGEDGIATDELPPPGGAVDEGVYGPVLEPEPDEEVPLFDNGPIVDDGPAAGQEPGQVAALPPADSIAVTMDDLPGGWTISVDGGACPLSLTETPWEGGLRASTRSCQSEALQSISSWQLVGQEVVLYSGSTVVARLHATSIFRDGNIVTNGRFEGQLVASGIPVSFFR